MKKNISTKQGGNTYITINLNFPLPPDDKKTLEDLVQREYHGEQHVLSIEGTCIRLAFRNDTPNKNESTIRKILAFLKKYGFVFGRWIIENGYELLEQLPFIQMVNLKKDTSVQFLDLNSLFEELGCSLSITAISKIIGRIIPNLFQKDNVNVTINVTVKGNNNTIEINKLIL